MVTEQGPAGLVVVDQPDGTMRTIETSDVLGCMSSNFSHVPLPMNKYLRN